MEHCINISDPTGKRVVYSNLAQRIKENIEQLTPLYPESCIYRVHKRLRDVNTNAYTPIVISIGPYHHGNEGLNAMNEHKLRSLQSFLKRRKENGLEMYLLKLARLEKTARKFYADPIDPNPEKFVEMMLLDGCFILEFLQKRRLECVDWVILRDMILLENQLPYFVLTQLYNETKGPTDGPLKDKVKSALDLILPNETPRFNAINDEQEIKHLLHLVHVLWSPLSEGESTVSDIRSSCLRWPFCPLSKLESMARKIKSSVLFCPFFKPPDSHSAYQIRSAVELRDAGVKFKKVDKGIFYIKFDNGLMEVPCFSVNDFTEILFRNLVAYEQHSVVGNRYFTDYITFMDNLINSEKDVNLLRLKGIVDNLLGDDQEVCKLFNGLGDGVLCSAFNDSYYFEVYEKVNKHCQTPWNQKKAKLRHNYFNNPWASISTIAAAVLLLLTLLQTIAAFISL